MNTDELSNIDLRRAESRDMRERISDVLRNNKNAMHPRDIAARLGHTTKKVTMALQRWPAYFEFEFANGRGGSASGTKIVRAHIHRHLRHHEE